MWPTLSTGLKSKGLELTDPSSTIKYEPHESEASSGSTWVKTEATEDLLEYRACNVSERSGMGSEVIRIEERLDGANSDAETSTWSSNRHLRIKFKPVNNSDDDALDSVPAKDEGHRPERKPTEVAVEPVTLKKFNCEFCPRSFKYKCLLVNHVCGSHEEKHKCEFCPKAFKSKYVLENHILNKHEEDKEFQCSKCNRAFVTQKKLDSHMNGIHAKQSTIKCELCPRSFKCKSRLVNHVCRSYKYKSQLVNHICRSHGVDQGKVLKCEFCPKFFKSKWTLEEHIVNTHVEDKEFECSKCKKAFITQNKLDSHMNERHKKHPKFVCKYCPFTYRLKKNFLKHMEDHDSTGDHYNDERFKCETCEHKQL
ncbi:unnamed protein product [Allacma fusca]|uniref:C2H2-type domain-containing protein n=1 Tax=Allacma fusca TaxID=39272 RepID=A0A8J2JHE9_9HEXA|nr:unnamed protein product [Allacma fusca]